MKIAVVAGLLPADIARACKAVGLEVVAPAQANLRLVIAARPLAQPPMAPWMWVVTGARAAASRAADAIDPADAAMAIAAGAYDVAPLGDDLPALLVRRIGELATTDEPPVAPMSFVARSPAAQRVLAELERVARTSMAVLLTGETGTGKDLAARHIHARSGRKGKLVPINCAAIPNELIEGELFGHARGAFSGAVASYDGLIHAAGSGTVFLDEVDDTPKTLQTKLLRVLEDRVVSRLGENEWHEIDFRLIAATNRDLAALVQRGEFGDDLYQRLAILRIDLPPLRDRAEDLPELALHLIARFYREEPAAPHRVTQITSTALACLARYPWPGNVRELRNVIYHALVRKRAGDDLLLSDLPEHIVSGHPDDALSPANGMPATESVVDHAAIERLLAEGRMNLRSLREDLERTVLSLALARAGGSPTRAARLLGEVGRGESRDPGGTVRAMMRRYGIDPVVPRS
jgi:DNA-binding NtrC family response regulator